MASSFIGIAGGNAANGAAFNVDLTTASPSAPSDGDLCIAWSYVPDRGGNVGRIGNSLSYNEFVDDTTSTATYRFRAAWKNFTTGEETVGIETSSNASDGGVAQIIVLRGHDSSTPLDVTTVIAAGSSTNPNPGAIVPSSNDCMILALGASGNTDTVPGTMTNYTTMAGRSSADAISVAVNSARRLLTGGAGASENPAAWSAWATGEWVVATVAIRPAGAAVSGSRLIIPRLIVPNIVNGRLIG